MSCKRKYGQIPSGEEDEFADQLVFNQSFRDGQIAEDAESTEELMMEGEKEDRRSCKKQRVRFSQERVFSYDQMKQLVKQALISKQEQLKQEFEGSLKEHLRDNFNAFTQFNRDNLSSQVNPSDFSYLL